MIVTLDGRKLDKPPSEHPTLRSLIEQVRQDYADERIIVSVTVNGERFVENRLDTRLAGPIAGDDQINLESQGRSDLVADALREIAGQMAACAAEPPRIADKLNRGDTAGAVADIGELVLIWQTCQKVVVQSCDILRTDLTGSEYGGAPLRTHLADLATKLRDVRDALEARDFVLLADVLNYEIPALCRQWETALLDLAASLGSDKT